MAQHPRSRRGPGFLPPSEQLTGGPPPPPPPPLPFNAEGFLAAEPQTAFAGRTLPFAFTPNRQQFFKSQFDPIFNLFRGAQGRQAAQGGFPTFSFEDFLSGNFNFDSASLGILPRRAGVGDPRASPTGPVDFETLFRGAAPSRRPGGLDRALLAPPVRFLF